MFHRFDYLKKFSSFHRFLKRGAPYVVIDVNIHNDLGKTNFHNQTPLGHVLNCCQFQQGNYILDCIADKKVELLEQDALFMIKAAKYMDRNSVLAVLKNMFVICSDPFSVSIHNDRGRFWLDPKDHEFSSSCVVQHNKYVNWKPYKGEPE